MGAKVSEFAKNAATSALKWVAKKGISYVGAQVPVIGTPIADWINTKFKSGGKIAKFAEGGVMEAKLQEEGIKTKTINTPEQLISAIKKFPAEAKKAGLTIEMVKEAKAEKMGNAQSTLAGEEAPASAPEAPQMKRGGKKGHVVEVADDMSIPHKKAPKKRQHKKDKGMAQEAPAFRNGGLLESLPYNNLDRLVPVRAHGGDIGLGRDSGEESYVQLKRGYAPMMSHQQYSKGKMC